MSTRCNLKVEYTDERDGEKDGPDETFWLYHHHDGYPSYVGRMLRDFALWYDRNAHQGWWPPSDIVNALVKGAVKPHIYSGGVFGDVRKAPVDDEWEITDSKHGDIDYLYTICVTRIDSGISVGLWCEREYDDRRWLIAKRTADGEWTDSLDDVIAEDEEERCRSSASHPSRDRTTPSGSPAWRS